MIQSTSTTSANVSPSGVSGDALQASTLRLRLEFLDGLRGLAALYVVLFHAGELATVNFAHVNTALIVAIGHPAVSVFIVLSGFCLMLPVARSDDGRLRGGVGEFFQRRARRILPPYYAALTLSVLALAGAHLVKHRSLPFHDPVIGPQLSPGNLLSHLLLAHNLSPAWVTAIDPPLWSVATEWQIYFFFPALLLPLWRRFGVWAALGVGYAMSLLPHFLLTPSHNFDWACPWYLGLFAMGMAGAVISFAPTWAARRARLPWGSLAAIFFLLLAGSVLMMPSSLKDSFIAEDALAGAAATCLILYCAVRVTKPHASVPPVVRALETRPTLRLGAFSYSLYLIHYPILTRVALALTARHAAVGERLVVLYTVGLALALALAYLFHLVFEKRFMRPSASSRTTEIVLR